MAQNMASLRCLVRSVAVLFSLAAASVLQASPWAVVADSPNSRIGMLDFGTTPATVHGPFLAGQLGSSGGGIFEVAITPDGKNALISNFGDSAIRRVDISNPTNPVVTGLISNGFFAEDIAIAPNGKFAIVTDGGFSTNMAIIDLANFSTSLTYCITSGAAQAVAIAPDNQTVIVVDYFDQRLIYGVMGPHGLVSESVLSNGVGHPVNVAIAPDGQTVLVANADTNVVGVFRILSPGNVVTGITPSVTGLVPGLGAQSIAFSPTGDRAYVLQNGLGTNMLSWLQINGPGNVTLGGAGVARLLPKSSSQLFGIDTLAVSPDGMWILASNPTLSNGTNLLAVVNASTFAVAPLNASLALPAGVAFVPTSILAADIDGDKLADLVTVVGSRWYFWFSTAQYQRFGPYDLGIGGAPAIGDIDGDGRPDLVTVVGSDWYIWFSTAQYQRSGPFDLGICGLPAIGDIDHDGRPDLVMASGSKWYIWFSSAQYQRSGPFDLGVAGRPVLGDIDRDGQADLASVVGSNWYVWLSTAQYQRFGPYDLGVAGLPALADMDGDRRADFIDVAGSNWSFWLSTAQYQHFGPFPIIAP